MTPIRVIIVDDDAFIRESLKIIIDMHEDMQVAATCSHGREAHEAVISAGADVVLMDIRMPQCDGVEGTKLVKQAAPDTNVLILTTFDDDEYIVQALRNGASGYLLKNAAPDRIVSGIRTVHSGTMLMDPQVGSKLSALLQAKPQSRPEPAWKKHGLTATEQAVTQHIANGMTNKEIAAALFLSEGTIKNYVTDILSKLELRDRTQLAIWYWKQRAVSEN
ncbi:response regulator transcription factor [Paenibacillus sp. 481]|nr:response regulator transcription factor [Paenibacillus sp. 481]